MSDERRSPFDHEALHGCPASIRAVLRRLLYSLLYFPSHAVIGTPRSAGLEYSDLSFETRDGVRLNGWWIAAPAQPLGHVLLCHGNGGNIGDRLLHADLLSVAGFDVLLFDYRGYGHSTGSPSEEGTYVDARAALACMLSQPEVEPSNVIYLGESLGGAVALELALEHPPGGLVLLSSFTGIRALSRIHYPFIPAALVPDAYPSLRRIPRLRAPLLVLHGERDEIVPLSHAGDLFEAAPEPKRMRVFPNLGHNDLLAGAGPELVREIAGWVADLGPGEGAG